MKFFFINDKFSKIYLNFLPSFNVGCPKFTLMRDCKKKSSAKNINYSSNYIMIRLIIHPIKNFVLV